MVDKITVLMHEKILKAIKVVARCQLFTQKCETTSGGCKVQGLHMGDFVNTLRGEFTLEKF